MYPWPLNKEANKVEATLKRLDKECDQAQSKGPSASVITRKSEKIDSLSMGDIYPYEAEYIIKPIGSAQRRG